MYKELLEQSRTKVAVWGGGTIGYSTLVYYAARGIQGKAYDVDPVRVAEINDARVSICGLDSWLNEDIVALTKSGLVSATASIEDVLTPQYLVHFIAVPTENRGIPQTETIAQVFELLCRSAQSNSQFKPLIIIESTTTPGTIENILSPMIAANNLRLGQDIFLASSPRRDWFNDGGYHVWDMDRVFGGLDQASSKEACGVLSIVCNRLHQASSAAVAEMTKVVENAYRFIELSLANQLSQAYPGVNLREVLELASSKWNMGRYIPGLGVGGHCIPVAARHILKGAAKPENIPLVSSAIATEDDVAKSMVTILKSHNAKSVAIMGLAYRPNMNISIFSPTIRLCRAFKEQAIDVGVLDNLFSDETIGRQTQAQVISSIDSLWNYDAIVIACAHSIYKTQALMQQISAHNFSVVIDSAYTFAELGIEQPKNYFVVGTGFDASTRPGSQLP
jgi:nucleotide sugar dehydrogenase